MPNYRLYRTTHKLNTNYNIDRSTGVLRGVVAMETGAAMGHGVWADMTTLHMMVGLGNSKGKVRQRLGHPGISEDATGKQVANASDFRIEGNQLRHDSHMLETARLSPVFTQDVIDYLLATAEQAPTELGESVVISASTVWPLDDGTEIDAIDENEDGWFDPVPRPTNALTPLPVLRPVAFHAVDFVAEGALTPNGMFSSDPLQAIFAGHSSEFAAEIFDLVDRYRARYHVRLDQLPAKVNDVLERYMAARSGRSTEMARKLKLEDVGETVNDAAHPSTEAPPAEESEDVSVASQIADDLDGDLQENDEQMSARSVEFEAMVEAQAEKIQRLEVQIKTLESLVRRFGEATQVLNRNYKRLAGEPVVSQKVSKTKQQPMEDFDATYAHPAPRYQMEAPKHVSERQPNNAGVLPTDDPRVAKAKQQMARNKILRGNGGR